MLREAVKRAEREGCSIKFVQTPVQRLSKRFAQKFDGVLCAGSVAACLLDDEDLAQGLKNIYEVLKPGGIAVFENRSFDREAEDSLEFGPLAAETKAGGEENLHLRVVKTGAKLVTYSIVTLQESGSSWNYSVRSFDLRRDVTRTLVKKLLETGFSNVKVEQGVDFEKSGYGEADIVITAK